jgi:hypothetical protein
MGPVGGKLLGLIGDVYRQRPIYRDGRWLLHEPEGGFQFDPFLQISRPITLSTTSPTECGSRLAAFLSSDMKLTEEERPRSIQIDSEFGLITDIERLQYRAYFASDVRSLGAILADEITPFVRERFGATHVCVVRPNYKAHQARISIAKAFWAIRKYPQEEIPKRIVEDGVLDSALPLVHELSNWLLYFLSSSPLQVALTFQVLGGYILFFRKGVWTFSHAAAAGIYGRFSSDPPLTSSDDGMLSALWMRLGSAEAVYDYVQAITHLVDRLSLYALNSANFLDGEVLDCDKQIRFIAALRLLFSDLLSLSQSVSAYGKVAFALSALDKLANIIEGVTRGQIQERQAFKACFSATTARGLRWIAKNRTAEEPVQAKLLRVHARHILKVQQDVRSQMAAGTRSGEAARLEWLRSYRNLRHGPFLKGDQFSELFVVGKAWAPSDLLRMVTALVIGLALDTDGFTSLIGAQATSVPVR